MIAIGELAKRTATNIETIRYYERIGVLPRARRANNGRRIYEEGDVRRLSFVRHARALGFELSAVRALLALQEEPEAACNDASRMAAVQLAGVIHRIKRLTALRKELARMVQQCGNGRVADCRVIEVLANPSHTAGANR